MLHVDADIQLNPAAGLIQVVVTSAQPHPMRWTLTVVSSSGGGANNVVQSGRTRGQTPAPLASVRLGGAVKGKAHLEVSDDGGVMVAKDADFDFGPAAR